MLGLTKKLARIRSFGSSMLKGSKEYKDVVKKYKSLSDFIINATEQDKRIVFESVIDLAIEDQKEYLKN